MLSLKLKNIDDNCDKYPPENNFDFRIILGVNTKCHKLNKKYLNQSQFLDRYLTNDKTKDCNILYITKRFSSDLFEQVLKCFYGYEIIINDGKELYELYFIVQYLQIHELREQIHQFILKDDKLITIGYQISELYQIDELSQHYINYFKNHGFNHLLNEPLDLHAVKKQIFQKKCGDIIPYNYLLLEEQPFKKLILLHNLIRDQLDDNKYLSQVQLAQKVKDYCLVHAQDDIKLKELLYDTVIRNEIEQSQLIKIFCDFQQDTFCFRTTTNSIIMSQSEQMNDSFAEGMQDIFLDEDVKVHNSSIQDQSDSTASLNLLNKLNESLKPFPIYEGQCIDNTLCAGLRNLLFQITTQYTQFAFFLESKIEFNKTIEDTQLQLLNLKSNHKIKSSLKINKLKFTMNSLNINNRLIIIGSEGISRYDDEVDQDCPPKDILAGGRKFKIEQVLVMNVINNPFR